MHLSLDNFCRAQATMASTQIPLLFGGTDDLLKMLEFSSVMSKIIFLLSSLQLAYELYAQVNNSKLKPLKPAHTHCLLVGK